MLSMWSEETKRYKDTMRAFLNDFDIPIGSWEQKGYKWRGLINKGAALYEKTTATESVKLKESAENEKLIQMGQQLIP